MHEVAGAIDGVDDPGWAGGEHTLGPGGCGLFCNEPAGTEGLSLSQCPTFSRRARVTAPVQPPPPAAPNQSASHWQLWRHTRKTEQTRQRCRSSEHLKECGGRRNLVPNSAAEAQKVMLVRRAEPGPWKSNYHPHFPLPQVTSTLPSLVSASFSLGENKGLSREQCGQQEALHPPCPEC